jgi:hypothetical protein
VLIAAGVFVGGKVKQMSSTFVGARANRGSPSFAPSPSVLVKAAILFAVWACAGCGGASPESFKPEAADSRQALEKTLEAWRSGKKTGELDALAEGGPKLHAVDSDWSAGKRLASFEITGELPESSPTAQQFSVKLQYEKQKQPIDAVYYVVGKDPILVFRDKDYAQSRGM